MNDKATIKTEDTSEVIPLKRKSTFKDKQHPKKPRPSEIRRGLPDTSLNETSYYFENYLRKVYPYYFTYTTNCKGRWIGKRLIDVFSEEFRAHSKEEYETNIQLGNIKVNEKNITADYILKDNDRITNRTHRHETAVIASAIKIIHFDDDFVVVEKPPSIPVHPCGRYRHNCLLFILAKEHNLKELYSVHRLDRLTSGLIVFTKTIKKSQEVNEQIRERQVVKEYVCRVEGEFPDGVVECNEPIDILSPKMGVCIVSPDGKPCKTVFEKLSFNGHSSVVRCKPFTGRMHQIRVHLQFIGYPIVNDPIYNHKHVFGPKKGKNAEFGKTHEQLLEDLLNTHNLKKWLLDDAEVEQTTSEKEKMDCDEEDNKISLKALEYYIEANDSKDLSKKYTKNSSNFISESTCDLCHQRYADPEPKDLFLFLHALKYEGNNWKFKSELPIWAKEDWNEHSVK